MGPSPVRDVDSRGFFGESYVHGTYYGRRKGTQKPMEIDVLHMSTANGCLYPVWEQELLPGVPCDLCTEIPAVP